MKRLVFLLFLQIVLSDVVWPQRAAPHGVEIPRGARPPTLFATDFPGVDILAQTSAAFHSCGWRCTVVIPPAASEQPYVASSTLAFPLTNLLAPVLVMTNACITYTGGGYAIDTYETQPNPPSIRLKIIDGCITGTPAGLGAFRFLPTSDITVSGTRVSNFTKGDAIAIYGTEGTLNSNIHQCNGNSFAATDGVCAYAGNMVHVHDGSLANLVWDIYEEGPPGSEHPSDSYHDNDINGGGGGIFLEMGRVARISSNYFESKSGQYIVLGNDSTQPKFYLATATSVDSNYFTSNGAAAITVRNGSATSITNNAELSGTPSACFLDARAIQFTYFVNNKVASTSALCRNGQANAEATGASVAHFYGDRTDSSKLDFVFREDTTGNLFLSGPSAAPTGRCFTPGQWVPSQDGHLSVCLQGLWVRKI